MSTIPPVRVRIAPSPTGDPHVGTAYVGLFNMALARSTGGAFILRIEDTDQSRSTPEAEAAILDSLRWVGLEWDEGPDKGGPHAPYRQSERSEIYREHAGVLVERGRAYRCFCSAERLAEVREEQRRAGVKVGYDRACRNLDPEDSERRAAQGDAHVVRLRFPTEGETLFSDALRGTIRYPNAQIDDQVLLKSDGFPTYHLANVVDDHLMGITHVIRAEEWIPSTPKHLHIYRAFGWEPPRFVHLSLLRNPDRSKISKRKNPTSLEWYREAGILPEALLNFLALMGWSMPDDQERFTLREMIEHFDLGRLKASEPVFDLTKLEWLNGVWIRSLTPGDLRRRLADFLTGRHLDPILALVQPRLERLDGFVEFASYFYAMDTPFDVGLLKLKRWPGKDEAAGEGSDPKAALRALRKAFQALLAEIEARPVLVAEELETLLRGFCERSGWRTRELFMSLRLAATGRKASPPLFQTMAALGKARVQYRIRTAIEALRRAIAGG